MTAPSPAAVTATVTGGSPTGGATGGVTAASSGVAAAGDSRAADSRAGTASSTVGDGAAEVGSVSNSRAVATPKVMTSTRLTGSVERECWISEITIYNEHSVIF
jgi:hypothetical protein